MLWSPAVSAAAAKLVIGMQTVDFFGQQQQARQRTLLLVLLLVLSILLIIAAIYLAVIAARYLHDFSSQAPFVIVQPQLLAAVVTATLAIILIGSFYKIWELRHGGEHLAAALGGRRMNPATTDPDERKILNVVEEMAIASGMAVPPVYLLDQEYGINAFAAGYTPDDAVIGISRGAIDYLNRDELQGVVAHEFSHILNGDMRFNLRLIGVLHGILLIGLIGCHILRFGGHGSGGRSRGGGWILFAGGAMFVTGYVGLFFSRLIKSAVSRQREYLADACAVQFTRNPAGIGGALKKIGGLVFRSHLQAPAAEMASHLYFGSAFARGERSLFATHPPLVNRVKAIDAKFDGRFPTIAPIVRSESMPVARGKADIGGRFRTARAERSLAGLDWQQSVALDPAEILAAVGAPTMDHVEYASHWLASLPDAVRSAVREPFGARCVLFALLLSHDDALRERQLRKLTRDEGEPTRQETQRLATCLQSTDRSLRLPLIDMTQGTLRQLSPDQYDRFRTSVGILTDADQKVNLFEFVVQCVVLNHLDGLFGRTKRSPVAYYGIRGVADEVVLLMSALARVGHREAERAISCFRQAVDPLQLGRQDLALLDADKCRLGHIQAALTKLATCSLPIKKRILGAAVICVAADGQVTVAEAELLRTVADSLNCPIPPLLPGKVRHLATTRVPSTS